VGDHLEVLPTQPSIPNNLEIIAVSECLVTLHVLNDELVYLALVNLHEGMSFVYGSNLGGVVRRVHRASVLVEFVFYGLDENTEPVRVAAVLVGEWCSVVDKSSDLYVFGAKTQQVFQGLACEKILSCSALQ